MEPWESVYRYFTSPIIEAEKCIQLTFGTERTEGKMRSSHQFIHMALDDLASTYTVGFRSILKNNTELNCFLINTSYCRDISDGKYIGGIWQTLSMRKPCVRCLSTMDNIMHWGCIIVSTIACTYRARARKEDLMNCLARSGFNTTIIECHLTTKLSKESLRKCHYQTGALLQNT